MTGKAIVCTAVLLFGGCPKRNAGPGVVYIPTPPPVAKPAETVSKQPTQAIVVKAPAPPAPEQAAPTPAPAPAPEPPPRRRVRRSDHSRADAAAPQPEPANVPAMEPRESTERESKLRDQVLQTQQKIHLQIENLNREWLSPTERETLEGARGFLHQSVRALNESDFQRAANLADKARLLVEAVAQSR